MSPLRNNVGAVVPSSDQVRFPALAAALRFAWRDLRVILLDYKILVFAIAIGVAAVTGVGALTDSFLAGLARDGRALVGGDISFARAQGEPTAEEHAVLASQGTLSVVATTRAMVTREGGPSALADLKAVEANYPLVGLVRTTPQIPIAQLDQGGRLGALLDPTLMARLQVKPGDAIHIGQAILEVRASIDEEPDRLVAGAAFAPRLILSRAGLEATGLVTPEALVRWTIKLALPPDATDARVTQAIADVRTRLPQAGFEVRDRRNASPQIERITDRIAKFLVVMGLLAVVVGGIGVWNAVALFVERQRMSVAIYKSLGASGGFVFGLAMAELLALASLGVVLGVIIGSALPFGFAPFLVQAGFDGFQPALSARAIAGGAAVGLGAALVFSILPAGGVHDVPGALLLRDDASGGNGRVRLRYRVLAGISLALFALAVSVVVGDWRLALAVIAGALLLAGLFEVAGRAFAALVRAVPRPTDPVAALAWTGLSRTTRVSRAVIVSLGVGLVVLAATSAVTSSLRAQLLEGLPDAMPNLFLVGLPARDGAAFHDFLTSRLPGATIDEAPLMRGRIVEIAGVPAEQVKARDNAAWVLEGDRGITFASSPPRDATIIAGSWWPADYQGPPLVSLGADAARGLGLKVGDAIAVNVAGRRVDAKIANLREINWAGFGINFVLVFSPRPIEAAPHTDLFTLAAPSLGDPIQNASFVRDLNAAWPAVIAIDVRSMLAQARVLVEKVGLAVDASALFTILAAGIVLAGAVSADGRARGRTATILKVLGGTRRQLVLAALIEFAILGLMAGLVALVAGNGIAWALLRYGLDTPFVFAPGPTVGLLAAATIAIAVFGLAGNWRRLTAPPGPALRRS